MSVKFANVDDFRRMARAVKGFEALQRDNAGRPNPVNSIGAGRKSFFPVTLSSPSGSAGSNGPPPTAASLTYTMTDAITGKNYGSGFGPLWARQPGHVTAASHGAAYIDSSGNPQLAFCDEVIDTSSCS